MLDAPGLQQVLARLARLMSHSPSHLDVRMIVQARARDACEYCLMPTRVAFEVDHVIPVGHWREYLDGKLHGREHYGSPEPNHLDNFAWSCSHCNGSKGERVAGRSHRRLHPLFHPRQDRWEEHFFLRDDHLFIVGVTDVGRATESVLDFNSTRPAGPLAARHKAIMDRIYPPAWARGWGY